jgi:DNA-binding NarL/FixJ family response regulator
MNVMTTDGLFERDQELSQLEALIDRAAAGQGLVGLIEGPAGIGKSRLLAEARALADGQMRVLTARAGELEREFPFGVVRQLFEAELADPERRERLLSGAAAPAATAFGSLVPEQDGAGETATFPVLHGLFWLALNLAEEEPLLLAIDDLHWCDRPSLFFLAYLARRLEGVPILVGATLRPAEPGTDAALMSEIAEDRASTSVRPGPLSAEGVTGLVRERLGGEPDEAFQAACRDATGGNPLLLEQLLTALQDDRVQPEANSAELVRAIGPRAVSRTVLVRLARLRPEAAAVARAVAVLGEGAALPVVARLADLDEQAVARATGPLAQAEILRPDRPLGFVHPLVRDAVYREAPTGERELQHARAATLLRDMAAPAEQVAAQLLHTSPRGEAWAAELLRESGRAAMRSGAADSAVACLQRSLDEGVPEAERPGLLFELGVAEALTNGPSATEHLRAAYESLDDPVARAVAANVLGRTLLFTDSADEAADLARAAAAEMPPELGELRLMLEAFDLMTGFFRTDYGELMDAAKDYRDPARVTGTGAKLLAAIGGVHWAYIDGPADICAELALSSLAGGDLLAVDNGLISVCPIVTLALADRDEAVTVCEDALALAHREGSLFSVAGFHGWYGFTLMRRGDLGEAEEMIRTADGEMELWGYGGGARTYLDMMLGLTLLERGQPAEARRVLERTTPEVDGSDRWRWWLNAKAEVALAEGKTDEALELADELMSRYGFLANPAANRPRSIRARALHALGRTEEALELLSEELPLARRWGAPGTVARALRELGELEGEAGIPRLEEAVQAVEGSPARLEQAKSLAALGGALRRARRPSEAREPLRRALELATACEAQALADHARSELYASGARPRREALSGVEALTPSERRVVDLAAAGQTNRDIAQELYVTPKTIEVHLSNAYRKLGIGSRRELPAALSAAQL